MDVRITSLMPQQDILQGLSSTMNTILQEQQQVASGTMLNEPSDNPGAVTQDLVVGQALSQVKSWSGVANSALSVAEGTDQALTQIEGAADTAYTSGLSLLNGSGSTDVPAVVNELQGYMTSIGQLANSQVGDIYVLGGTSGTPPWSSSDPTAVSSGPAMTVQLGSSVDVPQNMSGGPIVSGVLQGVQAVIAAASAPASGQPYTVKMTFNYGSTSYTTSTTYTSTTPPGTVTAAPPAGAPPGPPASMTAAFDIGTTTVDQMNVSTSSYNVGSGTVSFTAPTWSQMVSGALQELQGAQATLVAAHAQFGSQMQQIQAAQTTLASQTTSLTATQASIDSTSMPTVIANLTNQEATYQAILDSAANVLQPSLAQYLSKIG